MDDAVKRRLLQQVGQYLDGLDTAGELPEGIAPTLLEETTAVPDLLSVVEAVTALAGHIKTQSRTLANLQRSIEARLPPTPEQQSGAAKEAPCDSAPRALLTALIEVRDRLLLGRDFVQGQLKRARGMRAWFGRRNRRVMRSVAEGMTLWAEHIVSVLRQHDVQLVACLNEPFNPDFMEAQATAPATPECPPGSVLNVIRDGFRMGEQVIRPARVEVASDPLTSTE